MWLWLWFGLPDHWRSLCTYHWQVTVIVKVANTTYTQTHTHTWPAAAFLWPKEEAMQVIFTTGSACSNWDNTLTPDCLELGGGEEEEGWIQTMIWWNQLHYCPFSDTHLLFILFWRVHHNSGTLSWAIILKHSGSENIQPAYTDGTAHVRLNGDTLSLHLGMVTLSHGVLRYVLPWNRPG